MVSKLWGIPPIVAGSIVAGIVLAVGWTCPTGGTSACSHAYIAGMPLVAFVAGALLVILGIVLIAAGGRPPPR